MRFPNQIVFNWLKPSNEVVEPMSVFVRLWRGRLGFFRVDVDKCRGEVCVATAWVAEVVGTNLAYANELGISMTRTTKRFDSPGNQTCGNLALKSKILVFAKIQDVNIRSCTLMISFVALFINR